MAAPAYTRSLANLTKRLRLSPASAGFHCQNRSLHQTSKQPQERSTESTSSSSVQSLEQLPPQANLLVDSQHTASETDLPPVSSLKPSEVEAELQKIRLPRAVQATYLTPLRHRLDPRTKDVETVAQLQMRSYSVRNLEAFADFAIRAAYFLKLSATGPNPLPRITQRWTVPRSNFIFKKSQENFERITLRRLITIRNGHPEAVSTWLAFLQKHRYYGIGMKANVWERSGLDVAKDLDEEAEKISTRLGEDLSLVGGWRSTVKNEDIMESLLHEEPFKAAWAANAPMTAAESTPHANDRISTVSVEGGYVARQRRPAQSAASSPMRAGEESKSNDAGEKSS